VLGLSVWVIYSVDHLLDARQLKEVASTERHSYFQRHFKSLLFISAGSTMIVLILLPFISVQTLAMGLILVFIIVIYLLTQRYLIFVKEFVGSILYSAGIILPGVASKWNQVSFDQWSIVVQFILVAWINLLIFSIYDKETDQRDKQVSFVNRWGERSARGLVIILFVLGCLLFAFRLSGQYRIESLIIFVMSAFLILILIFKVHFSQSDRFRLLGDAIFLLPLLIWL
jgi:4-hydroxybenzoate polyprenyltransferase